MKAPALIGLTALAITILAVDCKKESDGIVGQWKITSATALPAVTINGYATSDVFTYLYSQDCQKDNILEFRADKTFIEDEGATKCDSLATQQTTGQYILINGSYLTLITAGDTSILNAVTDNLHMKMFVQDTIENQATVVTLTFNRQ